jgi:glycosyltransferase involved in cell wall biosynthesis
MSAVLEADLVHCHQCHTFLSNLVVLFAKAAGKVVVATDLGGGTRNYEAEIGQNDRIDEFHLLSEFSANAFRAWREKVRVVYGGFSERVVCGDSSRERRGVVYVGRFLPHKGVDYLIEAVGADTELHLLGRPLDDGFFARLLRLSLGKRVIFHLEAEDAEVAEAYAGAVAAVLPSVYKDSAGRLAENAELLGLAAIEAMANATPVVVTRVASLPELVTDGETGFVVPPNDPAALGERIAWLLERPREARRMGRAARARARERFTWTAVARACVERYRALFDRAAS